MTTLTKRLLLTTLVGVCLVVPAAREAFAGLTLDVNTKKATANSVWDFKAVWQHDEGFWPFYMPDVEQETIQPNPSSTIMREHRTGSAAGKVDLPEDERDVDDIRLGIKLGTRWSGDTVSTPPMTNDFQRAPFPTAPPPTVEVVGANTITTTWTYPTNIPTVAVQGNGVLEQVFIPRHTVTRVVHDDGGTPGDGSDDTTVVTTWTCPPVIVSRFAALSTDQVSINLRRDGGAPYNDFILAMSRSVNPNVRDASWFCRQQVVTISGGTQTIDVACGQHPVWMGGARVPIIVLDPYSSDGDCDDPDGDNPENDTRYMDAPRAYIRYIKAGTSYVVAARGPLPRTSTVYEVPLTNSLDGSVKVKINTGILTLDPNRTNPNDADPRYPDRPGINSPLLGVYDNPGLTGTNYFKPGRYSTPSGRYGMITIPKAEVPAAGWTDNTTMYVHVSTFAVDAVWTKYEDQLDVRYPKRINYFRTPEWTAGVITGTVAGDPNAYVVTPDINPNAVRIRTVTGVYLPQIMGGRVVNSQSVIPNDLARMRHVLAVFALHSQSATRFDDIHVTPANPGAITFVSAVYAVMHMSGAPTDPRHVAPADPSLIHRVVRVLVGGIDYYDTNNPFLPGDTAIALKQDLPPSPGPITIEYETMNLFDPDNPELAFHTGDTLITLNNPLPNNHVGIRVVYGVGTGLDGVNYYDPNNASTTWRSDETQVVLKTPLPQGTTDVRILYGTDADLEIRGAAVDANNVAPPNIWAIGRVKSVYAIREMDGVRIDDRTVAPYDPMVIRKVLGVYADSQMSALRIDDTHIGPPTATPSAFLAIRRVNGVYVIDVQNGTPDPADAARRTVIPTTAGIISRVYRVYDASGNDYYDPDNPETTFRPGDPTIRLSVPLPGGLASVTVRYETVNLVTTPATALNVGDPAVAGDESITLNTAMPSAQPISIRVDYSTNINLFNPANPVQPYNPGDDRVVLNTALPPGTVDVSVVYAEAWNRYRTNTPPSNPTPDFAPGEDAIPLLNPLPADSNGAIVEYSAHLFSPFYPFDVNGMEYNPDSPATFRLRPFIMGDMTIRLNRLDNAVALPARVTAPGALKLVIAYQTDKKVKMGEYTTAGRITPPIPLPEPPYTAVSPGVFMQLASHPLYIDYRELSNNRGMGGTYTVSRPYGGAVTDSTFAHPDHRPLHAPLPGISSTGQFSGFCFAESPPTPFLSGSMGTVWYRRQLPDLTNGAVWITNIGGKYRNKIPMYLDPDGGYDVRAGVTYRVAVSAGLNMSHPKQQPSLNLEENRALLTNQQIFDPRGNPMWYAPGLRANGDGTANTRDVRVIGWFINAQGMFENQENAEKAPEVTIHDSRRKYADEMIDHGGQRVTVRGHGRNDTLEVYPVLGAPDPLIVEPFDEVGQIADNGSSSNQFVFRVRYVNEDGLPPLPWLGDGNDIWNSFAGQASGVVLYLDEKGTGDYQPHFMKPEDPNKEGAGQIYIYRVIPHHQFRTSVTPDAEVYPWHHRVDTYQSLACGNYQYFFACSDDSLKFEGDTFPFDHQSAMGRMEWGHYGFGLTRASTGLDPSYERRVTGFGEVNRPEKRRYSTDGILAFDATIYVDRPVLVPGQFSFKGYPYIADQHPKVTCELGMPVADPLNVPYDDEKYGYGRFFGTIAPFKRMVNPLYTGDGQGYDPVYQGHLVLSESAGVTSQTDNVFRILYKQKDGKAPIQITVNINNAKEKSGNTPGHKYTSYTMYPRADQTPPFDYKKGVWYEYKTKLPVGPHTYYFQAYDGEHIVRFPVRPDLYRYGKGDDPNNVGWWVDSWVPTGSVPSERGSANYFDNDYFPGPYVNNRCVISEAAVTPGTGKEGQKFTYRVKYTDPDGQKPFVGYVYIETNNRGDVRRFQMRQQTPFLDPSADHSEDYKNGVYYILDTSTIKDFALENGTRRFYFEFTDDWGPHQDINDIVEGETTRFPQAAGSWIPGPVISGNRPPTLSQASVKSQDGTANPATLWTYRVNYRDLDNDAPALVKVYIGQLQPDGRTVMWDDGHTLQPTNPADKVYSDGAEFSFQTRLGGTETFNPGERKHYFYAFVAYDGVDWATYYASSNDELRSDAANCFLLQDMQRIDSKRYGLVPLVVQQGRITGGTTLTPDNPGDILRVIGVYQTEDTTGATYYNPAADPKVFKPGDTQITIAATYDAAAAFVKYLDANNVTRSQSGSVLAGGASGKIFAPADPGNITRVLGVYRTAALDRDTVDSTNYYKPYDTIQLTSSVTSDRMWIRYEAQAPVVGPLPIELPAPAGVIPDAEIYENVSVNPVPILIDDQKNGWISPADPDADRSTIAMRGVAIDPGAGQAIASVTPDWPRDIASVEGVYLNADLSGENYYDAQSLETPMFRTGQVDPADASRMTVLPNDPDKIVKVLGVYDSSNPNSPNYYLGQGYPSVVAWQEALIVGYNTVWPKNPYDVVSIQGVYLSMDTTTTNYYRTDGMSLQTGTPDGLLVQPTAPQLISLVRGVYLTQSELGANYYDTTKPYAVGDYFINPTANMPAAQTVYIQYENSSGVVGWQSGTVYVGSVAPNDPMPVGTAAPWNGSDALPLPGEVQGVYLSASLNSQGMPVGSGRNHYEYDHTNTSQRDVYDYANGDNAITLTSPIPLSTLGTGGTVYIIYRSLDFGFGAEGEYIGVSRAMNPNQPTVAFVAYYPRGTVQQTGAKKFIRLSQALPPGASQVNIKVQAKAFSCGDLTIPLTKNLPAGTSTVYIKYADIRFTHQLRGDASQPWFGGFWTTGGTHYSPDGWTAVLDPTAGQLEANVHIKNNQSNVTSGVVGVWLNANRDGVNYFDPRAAYRHRDNPLHLRLSTPAPDGTWSLYGRYYQKGKYHIDRWNREVAFLEDKNPASTIQASYFFGTRMPQALGPNTPPELREGKISRITGSRSDQYTYTVTYRDLDGPNGQAPVYVRVYIDGIAHEMTSVNTGTPPYREGAVYTYTPAEGLAGGSHKYHFEASDGADVAIYDWYTENSQPRPTSGQSIKDIDGPWVNNPPQLSDGSASPNPENGGINPWDSVDYTVTYTDPDNDEPYFWDAIRDVQDADSNANGIPDGKEWTGSPRVWIDSGANDETFAAKVAALESDPLSPDKKRTIRAVTMAGASPNWSPDQFAGKLMQITNGAISGRVYLIQSNTANTLVIATDDLQNDGVVAGGDSASQFAINGLLMSKADPTQQDFTRGVVYRLTVPKLAVGNHKFHFAARSRESKPQWLMDKLPAEQRVPYSALVRFPTGGDINGPNVISKPPEGNSAPQIKNTADTSLYVGPKDQLVSVQTLTEVGALDATQFALIREARGVFVNANDFSLSAVGSTGEDTNTYYDPKTAASPFKQGDTRITLTRALPASPAATLVQFGNVNTNSLLELTPDSAGVIGSVIGVYLLADPALVGTNYFLSADGQTAGTFSGGKIGLKQALPSGTKRVYVKYNVKAGLNWTSLPVAVPVYVKYFSTTSQTTFKASDIVTFRIDYKDADGDPPTYHDNVQGYVKLVFNDINQSRQMRLLNPPAAGGSVNYKSDVAFTTEPMNLPEGRHKYHFEASDGYYFVRFPAGTTGDPAAGDYSITVNYKPVIASAKVEPATGQTATTFTFTAKYTDQDGPGAKLPRVSVRIIGLDGAAWEEVHDMAPVPGSPNYSTGVDYVFSKKGMPSGRYSVVFEATDGDSEDAVPFPAPEQPQIVFTVRETNSAPQITAATVEPGAGKLDTSFVYKATYRDADGDSPIGKTDGRKDVLTVTIDKGAANEIVLRMTKSPTAPANPTPENYMSGVDYVTTEPISGKRLGAGRHTYEITASDGTADAKPVVGEGPVLLVPYFDNFRIVDASAAQPNNAPAIGNTVVGKQVLIVGNMKFQDNPVTTAPGQIDNITIQIVKPDGTALAIEASTTPQEEYQTLPDGSRRRIGWTGPIQVRYDKAKDVDPALATGSSLTLTASGDWRVNASWPGDTWWNKTDTQDREARVTVGGPMRTVAVSDPTQPDDSAPAVDMITPPKIIGAPGVGQIFGHERALDMQIVRWDPGSKTYFRYGIQGTFPGLLPGEAIWIKPKALYPLESIAKSQVDSGLLALGNPEVAPNYQKQYRLIKAFVKDYVKNPVTGKVDPCVIPLRAGWNQFGNIFFNYRKDAAGQELWPKDDVGIPIGEVKVRYLSETKTLAAAAAAGWIRDYAWRYDVAGRRYVQVHSSAAGAERVLRAWSGYWIRAFVDCDLIVDPNTTFNGVLSGVAAEPLLKESAIQQFDMPPPAPE